MFFSQSGSTHEEIARVGELFVLKLLSNSIKDTGQFSIPHVQPISSQSMFDIILFQIGIPPTNFSSCQILQQQSTYHAVQQWHGNEMSPTEWGWQRREGILVPVISDRPVAPEKVLKMISCGCKTGCGKRCSWSRV